MDSWRFVALRNNDITCSMARCQQAGGIPWEICRPPRAQSKNPAGCPAGFLCMDV
jgi:hypothetical protein